MPFATDKGNPRARSGGKSRPHDARRQPNWCEVRLGGTPPRAIPPELVRGSPIGAPKEATEEMVVSAVIPGASYSVHAESDRMRYESVFTLHPTGKSVCTLTLVFSGEPATTASCATAATVGRLFVGQTRKALEKDLADIAAAAEAQAV